MGNDKPLSFITYNEQGERMDCDVVFMFEATGSGNNIIVYTDNTQDNAGNLRIYASAYDPADLEIAESGEIAKMMLRPIEDPTDWDTVNEILCEMAAQVVETVGGEDDEESVATLDDGKHPVINVHYPE